MAGLFDDIISHQIGLERAKAGEVKRVRKILSILDTRILAIIDRLPDNYTQSQLNAALLKIERITNSYYSGKMVTTLNNTGRKAVSIEVDFASGIVDKYLSDEKIVSTPGKRAVFNEGIRSTYQGKRLPTWTRDLGRDKANRISKSAKSASVGSSKVSDIRRAVKKSIKDANFNADTITKTYVNQFTNLSRDATYESNGQFVDAIIWSTILDSRTTPTCAARSNKRYNAVTKEPIGHTNLWEGGPGRIHWGCRSVPVPVNKAGVIVSGQSEGHKFADGERTAIGGEEDYQRGDNKKKDGSIAKIPTTNNLLEKQVVPATLNYDDWLRTQPREFVEDTLGVGKARLFLDEKMSIQNFVVPDGRELTLQQLEAA